MRRLSVAGLAGLLLMLGWLLAGASAASAQGMPPGSYLRSCQNVQVRGPNLTANCATRNGQWVGARLNDFPSCRGDISNQNGQLWCERGRGPGPMPGPVPGQGFGPPGSYRQSCGNIEFRNGVLAAMCRTRSGSWQVARLNTATCQPGGDIANQNGNLVCPPRQALRPPPGSYLASCRNATLGGAGMLRAQCQMVNGAWMPAELNTNFCRPGRDIANRNGRLVCN